MRVRVSPWAQNIECYFECVPYMKKILFLSAVLFVFLSIAVKPVNAQVRYEDVVEKIHYTDPQRRVGPDNHLLEAQKETGSSHPILKAYIFGDLNGPYTKKFFDDTFEKLVSTYSGTVLFIYKHSPFLGQDASVRAGMIGECTAAQGYFWDNIKPIMEHVSALDELDYLENVDQFKMQTCLDDPLTKNIVIASGDDAKLFGLNGNPIVVIQNAAKPEAYSIKVNGAQEYSIFERAFLEAEQGDLTKKQLEDLQIQVSALEQNVQQNKQDVKEVKTELSRLGIEFENLKQLVLSLFERLKQLFQM